jgi:hypothetical protein
MCTSGQLHVHKLYPTSAHWQAWWAMVAKTEIPILTGNRPRSRVLRVDTFPGHIFSKCNKGMFVGGGGGKGIGPHVWIIYSYDVVLLVRSCDFLFLSVGSDGVVGLRVGGLLLRQSMTCSLFVLLVGLHRYRLTQYSQITRKMTSFRTWFLSVEWLMVSPRELLSSAGVCEMWCWYVCVIFLIWRPKIVFMARHVSVVYKVTSFERIINLYMGLTKDVVRM